MLRSGFLKNKNKGFTLIELLVVISIIGLLSTVILAAVQSARANAKWRKFDSEIIQIRNAVALYRTINNGNWPTSINVDDTAPLLNVLASELKSAGIFSSDTIVPPTNSIMAQVARNGTTLKYSCGQSDYLKTPVILMFFNNPAIKLDTKLPRAYFNGTIMAEGYYCLEI